jgi:hypothetical protein
MCRLLVRPSTPPTATSSSKRRARTRIVATRWSQLHSYDVVSQLSLCRSFPRHDPISSEVAEAQNPDDETYDNNNDKQVQKPDNDTIDVHGNDGFAHVLPLELCVTLPIDDHTTAIIETTEMTTTTSTTSTISTATAVML